MVGLVPRHAVAAPLHVEPHPRRVTGLVLIWNQPARPLDGEAQLRLTVQYYFLPLGRCIHTIRDANGAVVEEGGVVPDIDVAEDRIPGWRFEERERLRTSPLILDYVDSHWSEIKNLSTDGDEHETARYPGFDPLHKSLETSSPAVTRQGMPFQAKLPPLSP